MNTALELTHRAIDLSDEERYVEAIALLTSAIAADQRFPQAYFERGMAYLNLNQKSDAAADFDRTLRLDPDFPGARSWRAHVAEALGDVRRAAQERLTDLRSKPNGPLGMGVSPQTWADCASALMAAGQHEEARLLLQEYFDTYARKVTNYACYETAPMRMLARLLLDSGECEAALRYAQAAYASVHRMPMDLLAYALALESASRRTDARVVCDEALAINDQMPGLRELDQRLA